MRNKNMKMKYLILFIIPVVLFFGCNEETTAPEENYNLVRITYPANNSEILDSAHIKIFVDEVIDLKIGQIFIDSDTNSVQDFFLQNYTFRWNTPVGEDNKTHKMRIIVRDKNDKKYSSQDYHFVVKQLHPPSNFKLTTLSDFDLIVEWSDNIVNADSIIIEKKQGTNAYEPFQILPADQKYFLDSDLNPLAEYNYKFKVTKGNYESTESEPLYIKYGLLEPTKIYDLNTSPKKFLYSPTGKFLAGILNDFCFINLYETGNYKFVRSYYLDDGGEILDAKISYDDSFIAAIIDSALAMWNFDDIDPHFFEGIRNKNLLCLDVAPDSKIVTGGLDSTVTIWDPVTLSSETILRKHLSPVTAVVISKDGNYLLTGDENGKLFVWNYSSLEFEYEIPNSLERINLLEYSPDGSLFAVSSDNKVVIFNHASWDEGVTIRTESEYLSFSKNGEAIAVSLNFYEYWDYNKVVRIWNTIDKTFIATIGGYENYVIGAAFNPFKENEIAAQSSHIYKLGLKIEWYIK